MTTKDQFHSFFNQVVLYFLISLWSATLKVGNRLSESNEVTKMRLL